ncbi:MAG: cobalamin B12-binding domain-containing protein [Hydrogenophaga sp.]|nr:cobalamin B12-binding domain-containing protein [Hydrogenophaga sp.]
MTNSSADLAALHTIADVERDTGLSKDTLRVWERRYGFPVPQRDALGERRYDEAQLLRLRHLRRLLDAGHRPGQVVALPLDALLALTPAPAADAPASTAAPEAAPPTRARRAAAAQAPPPAVAAPVAQWMELLRQHDAGALRQAFSQYLMAHGLASLVRDGIAAMNVAVGQAWIDGRLAVFEEHLYTEVVQGLLRHAMGQVMAGQPRQPPRVLLTTIPGEPHGLGLLMAESFLVLEGCDALALGVQTPLPDIEAAALACRADVVALGFTAVQNPRDVLAALARLRERLPPSVEIWAGGQCPALYRTPRGPRRAEPPAFWPLPRLDDIAAAVARWRDAAPRA